MFSINNDAFTSALDRFAHFFIDPLFNSSSIGRELHAVDQEHAKNIENDGWRQYMIFKETGNPLHPNAKFSTGNAQTLGGIPNSAMIAWHEKNYSSDKMHLVVLSALPLDELIKIVATTFSEAPNREITRAEIPALMTSSIQRGHFTYIKPIKDLKILSLIWEVPHDFAKDQERKVADLMDYVLSNGSEKSLEEELKKEHLAESVHVSSDRFGKEQLLFSIDINLTESGLSQMDAVIKRVFQSIARVKKTGIPNYIFQDVKKIGELGYQYQARQDAFEFVQMHAHQMVDEDLSTYPQKTLVPTYYDAKFIAAFVDCLTPQSCLYVVQADPDKLALQMDRKEKWMGAEYTIKSISDEKLTAWENSKVNANIDLPPQNPFIPNNLTLLNNVASQDKVVPLCISNDDSSKVYFASDSKYLVPKIVTISTIRSPLLDGSAKSIAFTDLYLKALKEQLSPITSFAESASLQSNLLQKNMGVIVSCYGYSDKASLLTKEIFQTLRKVKPSKEQFENYKQSLEAAYKNGSKEMPFQQGAELMSSILFNVSPTNQEKLCALRGIDYEQFLEFSAAVFKKAYVESLFYGNLTQGDAEELWTSLKTTLKAAPYPVTEQKKRNILILPERHGPYMVVAPTTMLGNAVILLLEEGGFTFENRAAQQILSKGLKESFFDTLRTKQQTGYIARAWESEEERQLLQFFAVQSSTHCSNELLARFELFIEEYVKNFSTLISKERFENLRKAHIATLQMPPENLTSMALRLNNLAFEYQGNFNWIEKCIESAKTLSYEQFSNLAKQFLSRKNTKRLAVLVEGVLPQNDFRYEVVNKEDICGLGTYVSWKE
jgi:insulysin